MKYSYRLYPTKAQEALLLQFCGAQRWIWNHFLDLEIKEYQETSKFRFKHKNITSIPGLKKEVEWLSDIPSTSLQQTLIQLDDALRRSFKKNKNRKGFPKFKKKKFHQGSFSLTMIDSKAIVNNQYFKMPKIGKIKIKLHRDLPSNFKSCTVKQKSGKWFVSFTVDVPKQVSTTEIRKSCGLDLNSNDLVVTSDNDIFTNPKFYAKFKRKIKKENKKLSNKTKGSNNWKKQLLRLQRTYDRITNQRSDYLHKISHQLVIENNLICIEDLNVKSMSKFNGHMVQDAGWSSFVNMLLYKSELYGKHIVKIDSWFPSTKMCSSCGCLEDKKLSDRIHRCDCGLEISRDLNAAINIRNEGINKLYRAGIAQINACGDITDGDASISVLTSSQISSNQEAAKASALL